MIEGLLSSDNVLHDDRERKILQNGLIPKRFNEHGLIDQKLKAQNFSNSKLRFEEFTRFNIWFAMHPEKVAGVEKFTSSREFPITIKGSMLDIQNTINQEQSNFSLKLKMQRSKAKLKLLKL